MRRRSLALVIVLLLIIGVASADTLISTASYSGSPTRDAGASGEIYTAIRSGDGTTMDSYLYVYSSTLAISDTDKWRLLSSGGITFPTTNASLAGGTITNVSILLNSYEQVTSGGDLYLDIVDFNPSSTTSYTASDYQISKWGSTAYATKRESTISSGWNTFYLSSAAYSNINAAGNTVFGLQYANRTQGVAPAWAANTYSRSWFWKHDNAGSEPKLVIEFTPGGGGDTTPPASLYGFANTTSCSGTNISFTRPSDTDYNGFKVWWNNVAETNQTNATTWYNKSGLAESTTYTLSTKTFDLTGNVNATFQNYSTTTGACGTAPVAAFSASNTTMCAGNVTRFTDASTNTPTSWYWEFGDGNTSTTQSPLVQYDVIGLKTVNLKATNAYGSDWENKTGYINVTTCAAPTPTPTPTPTTVPPTTPPTSPPTYSNLWCGIQNGYFQDIPSGVDGFRDLHNYASGNPLVDENVTITDANGVVFIDSYISPPGALTNVKLLEGLRNYNIYGYVSSVSQPSYFTFNVSKYDTATNKEIFFYNMTSVPISSVTPTLDKTYYTSPKNVSFSATERILIRIGAYTTRNTATTIHFLNQGTTPTYVQSGYFQCPVVSGAASNTDYGFAICALAAVIFGMLGTLVLIRRKQ